MSECDVPLTELELDLLLSGLDLLESDGLIKHGCQDSFEWLREKLIDAIEELM